MNIDTYCQKRGTRESCYGSVPVLIAPGKNGTNNVSLFWNNPSCTYIDLHIEQFNSTTYWSSESGDTDFFVSVSKTIPLFF